MTTTDVPGFARVWSEIARPGAAQKTGGRPSACLALAFQATGVTTLQRLERIHCIQSLPCPRSVGTESRRPSRMLNRLSTSTHLRCVPVGASICSRPQMSRSRGNRTARTARPAGANRNAVFRNFYFTNGQAEHRVRGGMESLVMCVPVSARHGSCRVAKERR
jgi:hypothetical protein